METKRVFVYKTSLENREEQKVEQPIIPVSFSKKSELKQALNSMYTAWIPLNQTVYDSIRRNVLSQVYNENKEKFLKDISMDFTILAMIFKQIPTIVSSKECIDPVKFLKTFDVEDLKSIFEQDAKDYSYHSIDDMQDSQAIIYKYTAISSQASQKFAIVNNVDPLSVYILSVLRGLANCLLVWNYPRLFSRALKIQKNGEGKLDDFIERVIGFSPNDLIMELLSIWNLNEETKDFIDNKKTSKLNEMIQKSVASGEVVAKVHEPNVFPEAINLLDSFKEDVKNINVEKVIKKEVQRTCEYYEKYAPEIFDLTMSIKERIKEAILAHAENKLRKNVFIFQCDDDVISSFKKVYINVFDKKFSRRALEILRSDTIQKAGFRDGCLYMHEEQSDRLIPILKIGDRSISEYQEINCQKNLSSCTVALVDSLKCGVPIIRDGISIVGDEAHYICGSFGSSSRKGVLYLEFEDSDSVMSTGNIIPKFKAILRCLSECLGFSVN